jgi:hypothetical protein
MTTTTTSGASPWPLNPRAVAVQGIGCGALWVALQGFWPTSPFCRAPHGPGFGARPLYGVRPTMAPTVRAAMADATRPGTSVTSRATSVWPLYGVRPTMAPAVRAAIADATRPGASATSRATSPNTTRLRR